MFSKQQVAASTAIVCSLLAAASAQVASLEKLALRRSYQLEQEPLKNFDILVQADRERAIALGRHKDQTPVSAIGGVASSTLRNAVGLAVSSNGAAPVGTDGTDVSIRNDIGSYLITIGVGEPVTQFTRLLLDTGSSNTWVNGSTPYIPTASAKDTGNRVGQIYGIGSFRGEEYTDTVTLVGVDGEILTAKNQGVGIANQTSQFDGLDGVLGLGPVLQTQDSQKNAAGDYLPDLIPTVTDTLYAQNEIPENVVGLSLVPAVASSSKTGLVTFGGVEPDQFNGEIGYVAKATGGDIDYYWGVDIDAVKLDLLDDGEVSSSLELLPAPAQGIVDSGTTLVGLSAPTFNAYMAALPGSMVIYNQLLLIPLDQLARVGNMTFSMGGNNFIFPSYAQVFPNEIAAQFVGVDPSTRGYALSVFTNTLYDSADSFTFGMYFLERYYSVYDTTNSRVGFAYTDYTFDNTSDTTASRRTKRAHRDHEKRHNWVDGKSRLSFLNSRSPFRGMADE